MHSSGSSFSCNGIAAQVKVEWFGSFFLTNTFTYLCRYNLPVYCRAIYKNWMELSWIHHILVQLLVCWCNKVIDINFHILWLNQILRNAAEQNLWCFTADPVLSSLDWIHFFIALIKSTLQHFHIHRFLFKTRVSAFCWHSLVMTKQFASQLTTTDGQIKKCITPTDIVESSPVCCLIDLIY